MISLKRYTASDVYEWNSFVEDSKNGTFLFNRSYMDYHADRFKDHSLMFCNEKEKLIALLPANERDGVYYSHQGLTYGSFILSAEIRVVDVLNLFNKTIDYLRRNSFTEWLYKQIPTCYHRCPSEEDEYALWRSGAEIESCLISTTIPLNSFSIYPDIERRRKRGKKKALLSGYKIVESVDFGAFWNIMEANLMERYGIAPVHTLAEMELLHSRFPDQIRLYLAVKDDAPQAGCVAYIANDTCVHIQYGHASPQGKSDGALDFLYLTIMDEFRKKEFRYMDFGNSNEQGGKYLNENLIAQKEGFGGRGIVYKQWKIKL